MLQCVEDDGAGGTGDREGLDTIRKIVRERRAEVLVTLDATRISPASGIHADFARACDDHGVRIAFAGGRPAPSDFISRLAEPTSAERTDFASQGRNRQLGHAAS